METELIIIRHGETDWNKGLRFQGQQDISLNQSGREQASSVRDVLVDRKIDSIYSSDLKRARETAEIIAEPHHLEVKQLKGLREMNFGSWEGLSYQEIEARDPDILKKWFKDPTSTHPPDGERVIEFQARIAETFKSILRECQGKRVVIVSHGGSIRIYLTYLLKMPVKLYWRFEVKNCGLNIVKIYQDNPVLTLLNSTAHLPVREEYVE